MRSVLAATLGSIPARFARNWSGRAGSSLTRKQRAVQLGGTGGAEARGYLASVRMGGSWSCALVCVGWACFVRLAAADNLNTAPRAEGSLVVDLLRRMTLDEKLSLIEGQPEPESADRQYQAGYLPGVPRLGIPALRFADGPPGVATRQPSTGMTCTMGLAATFSVADARDNGVVIGRDAKALGQDVVLEPYINLDRDTVWGRGFNTFGEDPWLTGTLGAAQIVGIQSQGVMAQAKHFIAFDGGYNVSVDAQTLHEVYLRPFALAVEAGVASIMCSYNVINGEQACGSVPLLTEILRNELGFEGFVTSDWGANHATRYLSAGLDLEMPGGAPAAGIDMPAYFAQSALRNALAAHQLDVRRVEAAAARILRQYERFGLLSGLSKHTIRSEDRAGDAAVVLKTAQHAATLLKNQAAALPLSAAAIADLVLIGPGAGQTLATNGGGEKPGGIVQRQVGPYQALHERLQAGPAPSRVRLETADQLAGSAVPAWALSHGGSPGLVRNTAASSPAREEARDGQLEFTEREHSALPPGTAATWSGTLSAPESGDYWLNIQALGATAQLSVDGRELNVVGSGLTAAARYGVVHPTDGNAPLPTLDGLANSRARLQLAQGPHALQVVVKPDVSGAPVQLRLAWVTPSERAAGRAAAIRAARAAHTAVVFVWSGGDLSTPLPEEQDQLVLAVAEANPRTIVVLNTSQPVAMPWLERVQAVLQMWFPGDEGGWATADVLLGRVNPGGRLPFTWPRTLGQTVAHQPAHPERASAGTGGVGVCAAFGATTGHNCGLTHYSEGVQVGYRFFDATRQRPLYPFGYGLSYTSFEYSGLRVLPSPSGAWQVTFRVRNTGSRAGDAVPQLYLGPPVPQPTAAQFAARSLAGFARVHVPVGESREVSLQITARQLQYWSVTDGWTTPVGQRTVYLSEDARHSIVQQRVVTDR